MPRYSTLLLKIGLLISLQNQLIGQVLIQEDFESGIIPFHVSGNSPEVVVLQDARRGNHALKSILTNNSVVQKRTELSVSPKILNFDVDKEYWVGISIKLGEDFKQSSSFNDQGMILQWHYQNGLHPEVKDAQPLLLRYQDGRVYVHNEVLQEYMASCEPDYNKWVDWVFHIKFSDKNGIIEIWRNGEEVVNWRGDNHQIEMIEGAYLKFGIYSYQYEKNPPEEIFTRTVYHDELKIAGFYGSYESVAPKKQPN